MKSHILNLFDEVDVRLAELRGIAETLPDDPADPSDPPDPPDEPPTDPPVEPPVEPPDGSEVIPGIPGSWIRSPLGSGYRKNFLWKPVADGNQPLVVLTNADEDGFTSKQASSGFVIDGAGTVHPKWRYTGLGNANQHHQRFAKYGYEFSGSCMYAVPLTADTYAIFIIPSPANRHESPGVDAYLLTRSVVEPEEPVPDEPPPVVIPPSGDGVLGSDVWIWREFSGVWDGVGINAPQIAFSGIGQGHIRTIYGNGEQFMGVQGYVNRAQKAKAEGAVGTCFDMESHFLAQGPDVCAQCYRAVRSILPNAPAPKVFLDHFIHAMDARPEQMLEVMAVTWGMSFEQAAAWCQANSDFLVPWSYNQNAAGWIGLVEKFRAAGYTKPMILLGELYRTWSGARPWTVADIKTLLANGQTIAGFLPDASFNDSPELVKASPAYQYLKRLKA